MEVQIYNTLSRSKQIFKPIKKGVVSMYNCGPTVYDTPHIGNYRTFIMNDIVRRVFEYNDYVVNQAMNITDIDDKTIKRSDEEKIPLKNLTQKYEKLFFEDLQLLNILPPKHILRATENITEMIKLVEILLKKEVAYSASDGIYINVEKVKDYGALVRLDVSNPSKERVANDEYDKGNPRDFAIWKFRTSESQEATWKAPFGDGRPGWHIECSAMSMKVLGPTIDIHTGGTDLMFPHHTNEIAQSESATGKNFVNYWIHGAFMNVQDEKMAKSKNNFLKLEDLHNEFISPIAYRYLLLTAHYRSPINFSYEIVRGAQNALIRLIRIISGYPLGGSVLNAYKERLLAYINDDFDMPKSIALVWDIVKDQECTDADKRATLINFDQVLGLKLGSIQEIEEKPIPEEIKTLAEAREEARKKKDWKMADAMRLEIESRGFSVKDTVQGIKISKKESA